jgi:hypothetical protein
MTPYTLLLRQVNPTWVQAGIATSQTFKPFEKDEVAANEFHLSAYNGDKFTPEQSYVHYTSILQLASAGTLGVSVGECSGALLSAAEDNTGFEGHCTVIFEGKSNSEIKNISKKLTRYANERGWLYRP